MNHIQTLEIRRIDQPQFWGEDDIIRQPDFNVSEFQKKIDKITGLTRDDKSILQIKWAWDSSCFSAFHTDWDIEDAPIDTVLRAKYRYTTIEIGKMEIDICPPRFVLEERLDPAQYYDSWEQNRYQFEPRLGRKVPMRPPAPRDGYYAFVKYIANHDPDKKCCYRAEIENKECFGTFRFPDESDLQRIRRARKKIDQNPSHNPYEPISAEDLARIQAETDSYQRELNDRRETQRENDKKFWEKVLTPSPEYSFASETRTPGGLFLPE